MDRTSSQLEVPLPLPVGPRGLTFGPGESFASRYTIVEEVGTGGMGQVYKALDRQLGRAVALKLIKPDHAARPEARERFQRELLLAQQVTHPNVCRVHDLGEVERIRYISMEFIEGQTLEDLIHSVGHLSPKQTVALGKQVCAGLGAVHDRGIVHRDLKPGNVMIDRGGHAFVMDFGMAYRPGGDKLTAEGAVLGTLAYLSPEHARGYPTDARSDLYAIGLILFEMLTGRRPPGDENSLPLAVRDARETCPPPSRLVPEVPAALDAVVLRCLERDPGKRYGTAAELEQALADVGASLSSLSSTLVPAPTPQTPLTVPPPGGESHAKMAAVRRAALWLSLGVVVAFMLARLVPRGEEVRSAALLPLDYEGPEANRYLSDFLPAMVGNALRATPGLQVAPFASSREFRQDEPGQAALALNVDRVVRGSLRVSEGRMEARIVVLGRDGTRVRSLESHVAGLDAAPTLIEPLAAELAAALGKAAPLPSRRNPGALDAYFEGKRLLEGWDVESSYEKAEEAFRRALRSEESFADARAGLALALFRRFQEQQEPAVLEEAEAEARRAALLDATLPEAQVALGTLLLARGRSAEAEQVFARAMELAPGDDALCRQIARTYGTGRPAESERLLLRAIGLNPRYWENYNAAGGFYIETGKLDQAQRMFERIITLRPESPLGYSNLAVVMLFRGKFAEAEPLLSTAKQLRPSVESHNNLGSVYYAMGRFGEAEAEFRAAIEAGATILEPYVGLGDALRQMGRRPEAQASYDRGIGLAITRLGINPHDNVSRAGLAMLYASSRRCPEARREALRATEGRTPPLASYYVTIALTLCGDLAKAEQSALLAIDGGLVWDVRTNPDLSPLRRRPAVKERLAKATAL